MSNKALARLALAAALVGGVSYVVSWSLPLPHLGSVAWKGTGVGFLTVYAALRARTLDGWLLAAVMGLGALGDVLLNAANMTPGGLAFLFAHLTAAVLYLRNRRPAPGWPAYVFALGLIPATAALAYTLPADRKDAAGIAIYACGVALMAATAWLSRFPRALVGAGGLMFVVSDLCIFGRSGPLAGQPWVNLAVWGLYFGGQAMIAVGVTRTLGRDSAPMPSPVER